MKIFLTSFAKSIIFCCCIYFLTSSFACKSTKKHSDERIESAATQPPREDLQLTQMTAAEVIHRKKIHALRLDSKEFRINGVRVNHRKYLQYDTPILMYEMPMDGDYVEILRCPTMLVINGGEDLLESVELYAPSEQEEIHIFQRNDFWAHAASHPSCILVATHYSDPFFADTTAPTGDYYYLLRACVSSDRLSGQEEFSTMNCSRIVTRSTALKHTNKRAESDIAQLNRANTLRQRIDQIGRAVTEKSRLILQALSLCQSKNSKQSITTLSQKKAISELAMIGIGAAAGGVAGAAAGGLWNQSADVKGKIGGAAATAVLGAGIGAGVAYMAKRINTALQSQAKGFPKDPSSCYQRDQDTLIENTNDKQVTRLCSCADVELLQNDLAIMKRNLEQLQNLYSEIHQKFSKQQEK